MAPHSSTLAWKIPWTEEPGGLQSMGSLRVRHDWPTSLSLFTLMHWRRKWQSTPVFLPGESQGQRSLVGCCLRGRKGRTRLKWLSSSSIVVIIFQHISVSNQHIVYLKWINFIWQLYLNNVGGKGNRRDFLITTRGRAGHILCKGIWGTWMLGLTGNEAKRKEKGWRL